jgi:hypothetical protein
MSKPPTTDQLKTGLNDPRALDILTTEHWSLLSARSLGYQEMFGRATVFIAILSGTVIALALLAQATHFGSQMLWFAAVLFAVSLFIGIATFIRCVAINLDDVRWVMGMSLIRGAYLQIVPELEQFFVTSHEPDDDTRTLGYGSPQRFRNLIGSLTTTSSVVAVLNSALAGSLACDGSVLGDLALGPSLAIGVAVSIVSGALHIGYAARFRQRHAASSSRSSQDRRIGR